MPIKLTEMQKSALLEAGNIGSGHAAIALSQLMGKKIMVAIPSIEVATLGGLSGALNDRTKIYTHVSLSVLGDARGFMFFTIDSDMAKNLCDVVMGQKRGTTKELSEIEISVLQEIGSILSASYLNAVGEMSGLNFVVSVPQYTIGKIDSIRDLLREKDVNIRDTGEIFCIRTEFIEAETKIDGYLILIMEEDYIGKVVRALGV